MKAGIAIDGWKLDIFDRHLKDGGFEYVKCPGITADTLTLQVETDDVNKLAQVIQRAQLECSRERRARH